jgi:glycosyltransferase involved in cell wall biosynthesis
MSRCGNCPQLVSSHEKDLAYRVWSSKKGCYQGCNLNIVTPSHWLGQCAKKSSLLGQHPVTVIPNSLNTNVFKPIPADKYNNRWRAFVENKHNTSYLLFGAMNATTDKRKGFAKLVSALQYLDTTVGNRKVELIVFGSNKPFAEHCKFPVKIPIHDVGIVRLEDELVSLYNIADVLIVPSLEENLSCIIMESLSCGTPVVAFNVGGNEDLISHRDNGYLADPSDCVDLADGIKWCLSHNDRLRLSYNARQTVLMNYTQDAVARQYFDLYTSLVH